MHLKTLTIKNFRALTDITVELGSGINVIVGPNAIGKTTILEAIRLAKSLLSQRVASEAQQTLISLGGTSPHNPNQLIPENLAQSADKKLEIKCGYQLTRSELDVIRSGSQMMSTQLVTSRIGSNNIAEITAYLSSENGKIALEQAAVEIANGIVRVEAANLVCRLDLEMDFQAGSISSPDPIGASFIGFLDRAQPFDRTKFSYFPADRALPRGEVGMQLGQADSQQQLESHNSQPHLKYNRLKNTIFSTIISGDEGRSIIEGNFQEIFSGVLKGRSLAGVGVNAHGLMSVQIEDISSGRVFDIDNLSSGEKGLVLTFLLMSRTLSDGSVVLLDEPELHLNPAVCKNLLSYMVDKYVKPHDIQMIICSHSPEILTGAFERDECVLFHLISDVMITKVRRTDHEEISEALRLVGTSESEALLYKGTIFVEGPHDTEILEAGFPALLRQYRLKDLGGRNEIEKQIRSLQTAESKGKLTTPLSFIFDRDRKPTDLQSTDLVRVLQWSKYCLENFLIDMDSLTDLLKDSDVATRPVKNHGELLAVVKTLAITHLREQVVRDVFDELRPPSVQSPNADVANLPFTEAAKKTYETIEALKANVEAVSIEIWTSKFVEKCQMKHDSSEATWDTEWKNLCDGKRLFREIHSHFGVKTTLLNFKKRALSQMAVNQNGENWRLIESQLKSLLKTN
ncbi:MAG: hypothetical protein JWO15_423 [Sphingomonadales bacterium]|nr:hypothetical protein [Sphingomonadales bacterium]